LKEKTLVSLGWKKLYYSIPGGEYNRIFLVPQLNRTVEKSFDPKLFTEVLKNKIIHNIIIDYFYIFLFRISNSFVVKMLF
jgi:hypothetical protein